jgi:hypothetical protein
MDAPLETVKMQLFDPRSGEDFILKDRHLNRTFSSLQHNLYVIDSIDEKKLDQKKLLKICIPKTSRLGFCTLVPWVPGAKKLMERIHRELNSVHEYEGSLVGYFDVTRLDIIDALFDIRAAFGEYKTGEWGFGGCVTEFSPPRRISFLKGELWDFAHLISQAEKVGCLLYVGDGYTTFLTRIFDDFDDWLVRTGLGVSA